MGAFLIFVGGFLLGISVMIFAGTIGYRKLAERYGVDEKDIEDTIIDAVNGETEEKKGDE